MAIAIYDPKSGISGALPSKWYATDANQVRAALIGIDQNVVALSATYRVNGMITASNIVFASNDVRATLLSSTGSFIIHRDGIGTQELALSVTGNWGEVGVSTTQNGSRDSVGIYVRSNNGEDAGFSAYQGAVQVVMFEGEGQVSGSTQLVLRSVSNAPVLYMNVNGYSLTSSLVGAGGPLTIYTASPGQNLMLGAYPGAFVQIDSPLLMSDLPNSSPVDGNIWISGTDVLVRLTGTIYKMNLLPYP
jgi:hypothetical protein